MKGWIVAGILVIAVGAAVIVLPFLQFEGWRALGILITAAISTPLFLAIVRANRKHAARRAGLTPAEREADDAKAAAFNQNW